MQSLPHSAENLSQKATMNSPELPTPVAVEHLTVEKVILETIAPDATTLESSEPQENGFAALGLNAQILRSIENSGYTQPTPIQAQAIPPAMAGRDLLLSAQTGSGKTAAFVLPILDLIGQSKTKSRAVRALILTPTRELAQQVCDSIRTYGANMRDVFCVPLVGGAPYTGQIRALKKGVQIIVATPGRLLDHMGDNRIDLSSLSVLVLDEADRMLDMGFAEDINRILEATPSDRQTIMSSATWDGPVGKIAESFTKNPEKVSIKVESAHIDEKVYFCDDFNHKNKLLESLICEPELQQAIIFTATKRSSEQLAERLQEWGHKACYLHGDLPQSKRNRILADVKAGKYTIVVATDVAARGIDVPAISHVFNYDLPRQVEDYVHRIGRSGRAGRTGIAINLCSRDDRSQYHAINRYLKRDMTEAVVEGLEPRFIEDTYSRSGRNSGKGGRNGSRGTERNNSRNGYAGRDAKYSGFKGDASKSNFKSDANRDGGRKAGFYKDGVKQEGVKKDRYQKDGYSARGERSAHTHRDPESNGKMLTSHEFNFFNETRKNNERRSSDEYSSRKSAHPQDRPARKDRQPNETHFNSGFKKDRAAQGEYRQASGNRNERRHTGERSFDSAKPKRTYKDAAAAPKSHNAKGFEARQYENSRKRGDDNGYAKTGQDGYRAGGFNKSNTGSHDKPFSKNRDGEQAVKRSGKASQRRNSSGKPI